MKQRHLHYILDGRKPVPVTLIQWAVWFEKADRRVHAERIGQFEISTVFLGLDHGFGDGPPLLFETMVFDLDGGASYQTRCATWAEAEAMHAIACVRVRYTRDVPRETFLLRSEPEN